MQTKKTVWLIRLAIAIWALTSFYSSTFEAVLSELGLWLGLALMTSCVGLAVLMGPAFIPLYTQSIVKQALASTAIMMVSAGTSVALALVPAILFWGEPLHSLVTLPLLFVSGALIAPFSVISNPISIACWTTGTLAIGWIARRDIPKHKKRPAHAIHEHATGRFEQVSDLG